MSDTFVFVPVVSIFSSFTVVPDVSVSPVAYVILLFTVVPDESVFCSCCLCCLVIRGCS